VFRVLAQIACKDESAGAECVLACGEQRIEFKVAGTGGWQQYRQVELGTLELGSDRCALELRARTKPGEAVLNLRSIVLAPR